MTWLIAIDESGDLGKDSRYFTIAAIINRRVRNLDPVFKTIPTIRDESKFYNSTKAEIETILKTLSITGTNIILITTDKHDYNSKYYGIYGNSLYLNILQDLLDNCFQNLGAHDATVFLDRSTFITVYELNDICKKTATPHNVNIKKCIKATSQHNKCIQVADYVAGTINRYHENGDAHFFSMIENLSIARKY